MKNAILFALLVSGTMAHAQIQPYVGTTKTPNTKYREYYTADGAKVSEAEAFMAAVNGKSVDRCVGQELGMGKSGKSASLKNIKKNN